MARPIPRALLPHTCTHTTGATPDAWQAQTGGATATLAYIRVESSTKRILTKDSTEKQLAALLIYDCINSTPRGRVFAPGEAVLYAGTKYRVEIAEPILDGRRLHHWEVGLV